MGEGDGPMYDECELTASWNISWENTSSIAYFLRETAGDFMYVPAECIPSKLCTRRSSWVLNDKQSKSSHIPDLILVLYLAAADVNPSAWLARPARALEHLGGKKLVVVEGARNNLRNNGDEGENDCCQMFAYLVAQRDVEIKNTLVPRLKHCVLHWE